MYISKLKSNFIKVGLVLAMFAVICFGFCACGLGALKDNPKASDVVYGNGGLAVQKGDYVYFVNGYIDTADVGDTNQYGNIDHSAIYRIKLVDGKVVETTPDYYNDEGELVHDKTLALNNLDILVPKVAGFEYSNLYIFGDYLYYTTPNNLKNKSLEVQSNYLQFYRVKLDRSGDNKLLYSSEEENSSVSLTMYAINDTVYQVILDGSTLVLNTIKGDSIKRTTISSNVNDASMPVYKNSNTPINAIDYKIYYTVSASNVDDSNVNISSGTVLYAFDLSSGQSSVVFANEGTTYKIMNTSGNYLYYTKSVSLAPGYGAKIYTMNASCVESAEPISTLVVGGSGLSSYALVDADYGQAFIYTDGSNSYYMASGATEGSKFLSSNIISNIVRVHGKYVYYMADSNLYRVDYTGGEAEATMIVPSGDTPKADSIRNFDVDDEYAYYFVQHDEHYYLHLVSLNPALTTDEGEPYNHFIGKLLTSDYTDDDED